MKYLADRGVFCGIHYPIPVHLTKAYANLGYKEGDFPLSEICASEYVSLPMFPELTKEQIQKVAGEINAYF